MDTKEAIEFLDKKGILDEVLKMKIKNAKKLAKLLKRGEAFEKMYCEIYDILHNRINEPDNYNWYVDVMEEVKQKYFPKEDIVKWTQKKQLKK